MNIDSIVCLCLDKRLEKWARICTQAKEIHQHFYPFIVGDGEVLPKRVYDYIDEPEPNVKKWYYGDHPHKRGDIVRQSKIHQWNAFQSHQAMIDLAIEKEWENVLFMEDDATILINRWNNVFPKVQEALSKVDYDVDMLYLGYWYNEDTYNEVEEKYLLENKAEIKKVEGNIGGLHGVVINKRLFPLIKSLKPVNPIDFQLNQYGHQNINSFFVSPKLMHTISCYSYCEQQEINREPILDDEWING